MTKKSPKIPTPQQIGNSSKEFDEKKDKVLETLGAALNRRKAGDKGDNPIFTDHVETDVKQAVIEALEEQGWSVQVKRIYGGKLHWYIRPAA